MRVSVTYDLRNPPRWRRPFPEFYRDSLDHMCYMEDLGFDAIWLQQHHFEEAAYGPSFAALAGVLAARTRRVRVGSFIKILPLYHPLLVAEEMALLDNLLEGRLDVGLGIGHRLLEFKVLGVDPKHRPSRMDEGIEIMKKAWTEEGAFSFEGRRFSFENVEVQPKPVQQPHPPIWVAARTVNAAKRAARHRCHFAPASTDLQVYEAYVSTLEELGEDPAAYHVAIGVSLVITKEDPDAVWERIRPHAVYHRQFYDDVAREIGDPPMRTGFVGTDPSADPYRRQYIIGDTAAILRHLEKQREGWSWGPLKLDELVLRPPPAGMPIRDSIPQFETFAKEILPVLRGW